MREGDWGRSSSNARVQAGEQVSWLYRNVSLVSYAAPCQLYYIHDREEIASLYTRPPPISPTNSFGSTSERR